MIDERKGGITFRVVPPLLVGRVARCVSTRLNRRVAMAKDVGSYLVGLGGIVYQQLTGEIHIELLLMFGTLIGLQTIAGLTTIARGGITGLQQPSDAVGSLDSTSDSTSGG